MCVLLVWVVWLRACLRPPLTLLLPLQSPPPPVTTNNNQQALADFLRDNGVNCDYYHVRPLPSPRLAARWACT